jgi:pimeloyl-ACP methyl ester carboxylesterase
MKKTFKIAYLCVIAIFLAFLSIQSYAATATNKTNAPVKVEIPTKDGFNLVGKLYLPKDASTAHKVNLIVMLHSLGFSSADWKSFPADLEKQHYAVFLLDLRGHGESIYTKDLKKSSWMYYNREYYTKHYPQDVVESLNFIINNYSQINNKNITIIGADIGANTAIVGASAKRYAVKSLVLISPSLEFKGIKTTDSLVNFGVKPVLAIIDKNDRQSYADTFELKKYAQGRFDIKVVNNAGSGMIILKRQPQLKAYIIQWINTQVHKTPLPKKMA